MCQESAQKRGLPAQPDLKTMHALFHEGNLAQRRECVFALHFDDDVLGAGTREMLSTRSHHADGEIRSARCSLVNKKSAIELLLCAPTTSSFFDPTIVCIALALFRAT